MNSHYDQAIEFILSNRPESVDAYLKSRKKYMSDDEYMLYAYKFYHFYPNSKLPTYRLFTFLKGIKHLEMAYIVIKRGLEKFPDDKTIWKYYISICHIFENVETQLDAAQKFTHKFPNDINAIISYAKILFTNERKDEAINLLVTTQKTDKYTYDVALNRTLADFYSKIFSYDKAIDILQQTFKKTEHVSVGIDLLHWYIEFKYYDKILQLLDVLIYKNGFLKSERVFPKLAKLLCTFKDSDNSLLDKFLCSFKNSDNTLSLLSKRVVHIISSQSKDIDVTNNFTLPLAGYLLGHKSSTDNTLKILNNYKELNYFNIIRFPFEKINININDINIQSLTYILYMNGGNAIERLNDIFKKNIITILSDEKKIYYALLFSVIVNNLELKNTLIDYVSKNSHSYSPFITSLINNWKNSTRHLSECSTSYPSNTQQKSPLKVAVCVSGQLRGWEEALPSWFSYFHLSDYQTDFYVSTWKNIGTSTPKFESKYSRNLPQNFFTALKSHYSAWNIFIKDFPSVASVLKKIQNIDSKTLQNNYKTNNVIIEDDSVYPFNTFTNQEKMIYKWNSCMRMVTQEYDLIIRIRPDIKFLEPYPSKKFIENMFYDCIKNDSVYTDVILKNVGYTLGCGDIFHIGRYKTIENISRLYSHIYSKNNFGENLMFTPNVCFRTHYTIGAYMFQNGIQLKCLKKNSCQVDPYIISASELLILLEKDISMRKMTDSDKEIIAACKADIAEEKASIALEK